VKVPFVDLTAGIRPIREQVLARIAALIDAGAFVGGPAVDEFERGFAAACGASDAVAVSTGTEALVMALRALGVGPGHEVITAPNSFFATAEAISLVGATPVFADVRDDTLCIDAEQVGARILIDRENQQTVHEDGGRAESIEHVERPEGKAPLLPAVGAECGQAEILEERVHVGAVGDRRRGGGPVRRAEAVLPCARQLPAPQLAAGRAVGRDPAHRAGERTDVVAGCAREGPPGQWPGHRDPR